MNDRELREIRFLCLECARVMRLGGGPPPLHVVAAESAFLKFALDPVLRALEDKKTFQESFAAHPEVFDTFFVNAVGIGEVTGSLPEVMTLLAKWYAEEPFNGSELSLQARKMAFACRMIPLLLKTSFSAKDTLEYVRSQDSFLKEVFSGPHEAAKDNDLHIPPGGFSEEYEVVTPMFLFLVKKVLAYSDLYLWNVCAEHFDDLVERTR